MKVQNIVNKYIPFASEDSMQEFQTKMNPTLTHISSSSSYIYIMSKRQNAETPNINEFDVISEKKATTNKSNCYFFLCHSPDRQQG